MNILPQLSREINTRVEELTYFIIIYIIVVIVLVLNFDSFSLGCSHLVSNKPECGSFSIISSLNCYYEPVAAHVIPELTGDWLYLIGHFLQ